ncbi:hypothetical protein PROFUN_00544 [Planoprotostelium fungivorum]|uniref:Uncharacterized protein n=1 Tax=Planoprotostelium fungivorum TaxID=1890364 RepID=A0A2P6N160_9EUKA|nr:hypothetical protein PROFUN_00544 [Planoprotostelium fungivorum]
MVNKTNLLQKAFEREAEWKKDELIEVIHWGRQIVGLICGLVFGLLPFTGLLAILTFGCINVAVLFFYYTRYLGVDDEDYDARWEFITNGFSSSFGVFMLAWILTYNLLHLFRSVALKEYRIRAEKCSETAPNRSAKAVRRIRIKASALVMTGGNTLNTEPLSSIELGPWFSRQYLSPLLDDPLLGPSKRASLISACAKLEIVLEVSWDDPKVKADRLKEWSDVIRSLVEELREPDETPTDFFNLRIGNMFPFVTHELYGIGLNPLTTFESYLRHNNDINNALSLCRQLKENIGQKEYHKYLAHQLALLYQSISHLGEAKMFRAKIEVRFHQLKQKLSSKGPLEPEDVRWLEGICDEITGYYNEKPPVVQTKLDPLKSFFS